MDDRLDRWPSLARVLENGRVCMTNEAPERALRGLALGGKARLFAGPDRGGQRAAFSRKPPSRAARSTGRR